MDLIKPIKASKTLLSFEGEDRINSITTKYYQLCFLADGHGGSTVSNYITNNFINIFDNYFKSFFYSVHPLQSYKSNFNSLTSKQQSNINTFIKSLNTSNDTISNQKKFFEKILKLSINDIANRLKTQNEGSTFVGFLKTKNNISVFNIGDSRCYAIQNNNIKLLTKDHNLYSKSEIKRLNYTPPSSKKKERRLEGVLMMTRSIGDADVKSIIFKPDIYSFTPNQHSHIILVSDGIYEFINHDSLLNSILYSDLPINQVLNLTKHSNDDRSILICYLNQ